MPGYSNITLLSSTNNSAGASATVTSNVFDPPNQLIAVVRIAGYSISGIARLQFNGDTGTTAYSFSVVSFTGAATPVGTGLSEVSTVAAGIKVSSIAQTTARAVMVFHIRNVSGQAHGIVYQSSDSETAATASGVVMGSGVWTTTAQITRIVLDVGSGGGTLSAGTSLDVYGIYG